MRKPLRKAIFPVGGLGTRFLPATKAMPKEMLPVVDKPLIQYAVEEARAAGIEEMIFVTGRGKSAIEDHFDYSYELQDTLKSRSKDAELALIEDLLPKPGEYAFSGSGLGLSICRKLVEAMGSRLQVETTQGVGTRFFFELDLPLAGEAGFG